jgi:hypothetical protein
MDMTSQKKFFTGTNGELLGCRIVDTGDQRCDRDCSSKQKCLCNAEKKRFGTNRIIQKIFKNH